MTSNKPQGVVELPIEVTIRSSATSGVPSWPAKAVS